MFDTLSIKDYITPGGYIHRLIYGLPSGVKSTSLFGSIINLVNLCHCTSWASHKRVKFIIGGDDFLIAFKDGVSDEQLNETLSIADDIGVSFKFLKRKTINARNIEDRPCFYKYTIDKDEPVIPTSNILERVFMPWNKRYKNDIEILNFLFDVLPSLAAPRSTLFLFYKFFSEMYSKITRTHCPISKVFKLHEGIYNGVMSGRIEINKDYVIHKNIYSSLRLHIELPSNLINSVFRTEFPNDSIRIPAFKYRNDKIANI